MNDCNGCKYENSTDIEVHLEFCTNCKEPIPVKKIENFTKIGMKL
jgi:hypothetical protein